MRPESTAELTLTLGLPGAGKSTWVAGNITSHVLTLDGIRAGEDQSSVVGRVHRQAEALLKRGESVCIDACSLRADHRRQWLSLAAHHDAQTALVVFRTPLAVCQRRDAARPPGERANVDWTAAARNLDESLKAIHAEGWDRIAWADGAAPAREDSIMRGINPAPTRGMRPTPARAYRVDRFAGLSGLTPRRSAPGRYTATAGKVGALQYEDGAEDVPAETLFDPASMKSLEGAAVTVGHPASGTAGEFDGVGRVLRVWQEGSKLKVELEIDAAWVRDAIEREELQELSLGYQADIVTDAFGRKTQTQRIYNHLALLPPGGARCGPTCRIDAKRGAICRCEGRCSMHDEKHDRDYEITPANVARLMRESGRAPTLPEQLQDIHSAIMEDYSLTPENVRRLSREGK